MCGMVRIVEDGEEAERTLQARLINISWISRWMRLANAYGLRAVFSGMVHLGKLGK
jgi:hypothetical protein